MLLIGTAVTGLSTANAQIDPIRRSGGRLGGAAQRQGRTDSIAHRTGLEDSITIRFRYLDTSRLRTFDSSLSDFSKVFPVPWTHVHLGNFGNASRNLQFTPNMQPGWDHGFHAYDIYNLNIEEALLFNTTRPFTHISYLLGSKAEQFIRLQHTQNLKPNWNMSLEYRLINAPGFFQNQNTNHNNYRFTSWFQSKNKRYQNIIAVVGNKLQSGENGGIKTDEDYLNDNTGAYDERLNIPTQLGADSRGSFNPFSVIINTGTFYTNATYLMRQQYDLGQKDSLVTDSSVIPLFYPRLRLEHTIAYSTYKYRFRDSNADSTYYADKYDITLDKPVDSFFIQDFWRVLLNDFSLYQFPDAKNAQQFIKLGASLQTLQATLDSGRINKNHYNFFVHGEYRNKTRNQLWDIEASGNFYVNGFNAGDYNAIISLKRLLSKNAGFLQLGFKNTNRTPSYIFDPSSSFYLGNLVNFNKENKTTIFASLDQSRRRLNIYGAYHLVTNYTYFNGYYQANQSSALFNVVQALIEKRFPLGKRGWNWKTWVLLQQRLGDGPLNLPLLTTRNQLGYDGKLGFKNLQISFGLEMRYFTPYKAPLYSPLTGQYGFQDTTTIRLKAPDLTGFVHFRIKSFTAYVRAQNLNALNPGTGKFTNNNVPTLYYPFPGLQIRVGVFWSFVN